MMAAILSRESSENTEAAKTRYLKAYLTWNWSCSKPQDQDHPVLFRHILLLRHVY
jgi:hypothetical protein